MIVYRVEHTSHFTLHTSHYTGRQLRDPSWRVWTDCTTLETALMVQQAQEYVAGRPARITAHEVVI